MVRRGGIARVSAGVRPPSSGTTCSEDTADLADQELVVGRRDMENHVTDRAPRKRKYGPLSAETRAKISASLRGKTPSPETRAKLSAALIGTHRPAAIRAKISAGHKARGNTEQHLRRLHSVGGRTGVAGRLNRGRRWVTELRSNREFYLSPDEAQVLVDSGESRWGRRQGHGGPGR
jgi:NUMOD3 motif